MKQLLHFTLVIYFVPYTVSQDLHTVSIFSRDDFKVLRPCANYCLYGGGDVAPGAGCGSPYYNQCWCSSKNIASSATQHISTCISTGCSDSVDVATAIDIYYDYCSKAGYPIPNTVARPVATSIDLHTVSIFSRGDFEVLRPCANYCLYGGGDVAPGAGCGSPYYNQCWCSSNIAPSATSHISTCITNRCTDDFDISTAVAIYYSYCSEAGYPIAFQGLTSNAAPLSTIVQTTSETPKILTNSPAGTTNSLSPSLRTVSYPTSTSTSMPPTSTSTSMPPTSTSTSTSMPPVSASTGSASGGGSRSGLSSGEIAGIIIGVFAILVGLAALWYQRKALAAQVQSLRDHSRSRQADTSYTEGTSSVRRGIFEMK